MESKLLEVRDRMTFIPTIAIELPFKGNSIENYLQKRVGYDEEYPVIAIARLQELSFHLSPFLWDQAEQCT